jgi:hypothetical protein
MTRFCHLPAHRYQPRPATGNRFMVKLIAATLPALLGAVTMNASASNTASAAEQSRKLPSDNYEQPKHTVIERAGNIEIREYAPMLLAEVDVEGDRGTAANRGFRLLAGYIFGGNTSRASINMTSPVTQVPQSEKIAMTSPVVQAPRTEAAQAPQSEKIAMTSPVTQVPAGSSGSENLWTVAFMMPSSYTMETLPKPNTDRIRFRVTEPTKRVVIRFAGMSTQSNLQKHRDELMTFLKSRSLTPVTEPAMAFYDDPFTLPWNRRNEWWVDVR